MIPATTNYWINGVLILASKYPITQNEATEQTILMKWAKLNSNRYPELDLLFHIPNGGSRNKLEAKHLKEQGVKSGVPDLCLPVPRGLYHGLYIELKAHKNQPSDAQRWWIAVLKNQGYYVTVCWGWEQAANIISKYLKNQLKENN